MIARTGKYFWTLYLLDSYRNCLQVSMLYIVFRNYQSPKEQRQKKQSQRSSHTYKNILLYLYLYLYICIDRIGALVFIMNQQVRVSKCIAQCVQSWTLVLYRDNDTSGTFVPVQSNLNCFTPLTASFQWSRSVRCLALSMRSCLVLPLGMDATSSSRRMRRSLSALILALL